jgi:hypothetical protein
MAAYTTSSHVLLASARVDLEVYAVFRTRKTIIRLPTSSSMPNAASARTLLTLPCRAPMPNPVRLFYRFLLVHRLDTSLFATLTGAILIKKFGKSLTSEILSPLMDLQCPSCEMGYGMQPPSQHYQ